MKIAVWKTGHIIADTVAEAVKDGLPDADLIWSHQDNYMTMIKNYDLHIGYGILRGCGDVFKRAESFGIPWIEIDKGYWKPGHYDGYYRISLNGTQQTTGLDRIQPDYERWDRLGLEILPNRERNNGPILVCDPTQPVCDFFGVTLRQLESSACADGPYIQREKGDPTPLQNDLDECRSVTTFNSSIGWEALRQGIPVVSDPTHSIVGAYQKMVDKPLHLDLDERRKLFAIMAGLQLRLDELKSGKLWPLIQTLLSI